MDTPETTRYCSACGAEARGEARFCQRCGSPLAASAPQAGEPNVPGGPGATPQYGQPSGSPGAPSYPPYAVSPPVVTHQQFIAQARMQAAAGRSYVTPAVITLILYFLFWLPGLLVNLIYLSQAQRDKRVAGVAPNGLGCLQALLTLAAAPVFLIALIVALKFLQPQISNTLNFTTGNL